MLGGFADFLIGVFLADQNAVSVDYDNNILNSHQSHFQFAIAIN
jgi:hypothetical protein